jgi:hypothetical protein
MLDKHRQGKQAKGAVRLEPKGNAAGTRTDFFLVMGNQRCR